ncbi:conserved hypothetical protein [Treponema primitia ZAS-2]|uniref:Uncharacterized protein n=1 Tax=Treponema primitia (strain ATCC BAA-887 / DSM 12427 / ZAS-2) TaxID=545694 RepID=F5YJW2_TREPZ|nr:hypothetical protein [Treponema primitia]AEF84806.1 conserved hypothetical protein [Treponema primitia ZAS-2]
MKIDFEITNELATIIPRSQLLVTAANPESYAEPIERLARQLEKCPRLYETNGKDEHPAIFHYFYGGTDIFICEYDREDTMFGYTILNNDLVNSEWGYTSVSEICRIAPLNIDYWFEEQTIETALYQRNPDYFKKPKSLD